MKQEVQVLPEATAEVAEIYAWYEGERSGLGDRFMEALGKCYAALSENPFRQKRKGDFRHAVLQGFPYRVVYEIRDDVVVVYQVRHMSRRPHRRFGP